MTTWKLDGDGDLAIENGTFVLLDDLGAETAQRLKIKFRFFLGEWEIDRRVGLPLFEQVLVKTPDLGVLRKMYREVITKDPAVASLGSIILDLDAPTRRLSLSFEAMLNDGSSLVFEDFILAENLGGVA
jgi:hypothetical protein